jgi:curved DNA-binding protein CbpA
MRLAVEAIDPTAVLGISQNATDEEIRAAYLLKVREYPPDRAPEQFEKIRDAYEILRDPRRRVRHRLFSVDPRAPLVSLFADDARPRRFVGPGPWLDVLKGK